MARASAMREREAMVATALFTLFRLLLLRPGPGTGGHPKYTNCAALPASPAAHFLSNPPAAGR